MTATALDQNLFDFATELFERAGGVVDWNGHDEAGAAIVPPDLARKAALPGEEFSLSLGTTRASQGVQVSLASDFLDVASRVLNEIVPNTGSFHVGDRYLKKRDLEEAVREAFDWPNARIRCIDEAVATHVEYHQWMLHARIQSDDLWESLVSLTINSASGAVLNLPNLAELADLAPNPLSDDPTTATTPPHNTEAIALKFGRTKLLEASADFVRRIEQRLERDRKRLQDYYRALGKEAAPKERKGVTPPPAEEIAAKKKAVDLELRRKLGELSERYALRAELKPLVLWRVAIPALAVPLQIQRKQATRTHTVYWNSLLKKFEPLTCSVCGQPTMVIPVSNDTVDPHCPTCFAAR